MLSLAIDRRDAFLIVSACSLSDISAPEGVLAAVNDQVMLTGDQQAYVAVDAAEAGRLLKALDHYMTSGYAFGHSAFELRANISREVAQAKHRWIESDIDGSYAEDERAVA